MQQGNTTSMRPGLPRPSQAQNTQPCPSDVPHLNGPVSSFFYSLFPLHKMVCCRVKSLFADCGMHKKIVSLHHNLPFVLRYWTMSFCWEIQRTPILNSVWGAGNGIVYVIKTGWEKPHTLVQMLNNILMNNVSAWGLFQVALNIYWTMSPNNTANPSSGPSLIS